MVKEQQFVGKTMMFVAERCWERTLISARNLYKCPIRFPFHVRCSVCRCAEAAERTYGTLLLAEGD
jgi:hypothetical protein